MTRRGRRNREPGLAGGLVAELDQVRRECEARGTWPGQVDTRACSEIGCNLRRSEHLPRCRVCDELVEHHSEDLCWGGKARMAEARRRAGSVLLPIDHEALDRFPVVPSVWFPEDPSEELLEARAAIAAAAERLRLVST